jgi:ABC-type branched-subunit amino acid transport system substrate-binding protein
MQRVPAIRVLASLSLVSLIVAACGSSSDSSSSAAAGSNSTQQATGEPILLGTINPVGTNVQNNPDVVAAIHAAMDGINEHGGIKGRPLELVFCNEGGDPNKAAACARDMVEKKVVATVRDLSPTGGSQMNAVLLAAGIPQVYVGALAPAEYNSKNTFPIDGGPAMQYSGAMSAAKAKGITKVHLVRNQTSSTQIVADTVQKAATKLGMEVVGDSQLPFQVSDYSVFGTAINASKAQGVILSLAQAQILQIVPAIRQAGSKATMLLNGGGLTLADYQKASADLEGGIVFQPLPPITTADQFPLIAQMKKEFLARKAKGDNDIDLTPKASAEAGWFAIQALAKVLRTMDKIDSKSLLDKLNSGTPLDNGITPPTDYSKPGPIQGFGRVPASWGFAMEAKGGTLVLADSKPFNSFTLFTG